MITIQLTRREAKGERREVKGERRETKAVHGTMIVPFSLLPVGRSDQDITIATLENKDYIIPEGNYPLLQTYSPRFKKRMPLIDQVPEREGIRIHIGTKPEHSTGCVLVDEYGLSCIEALFNRITKYYEHEQIQINIRNA